MPELSNNELERELEERHTHMCKRCGFDQREDFNPVSEEILEEYFRAALAQRPFTKDYELYHGALQLTFEESTGKLLKLQEKAILEQSKAGEASVSDAADFSMVASLISVRQAPANGSSRELYHADLARREKILTEHTLPEELTNMPIIQLQALRSTYTQFAKLCGALIAAAQDENFWQGVGRN